MQLNSSVLALTFAVAATWTPAHVKALPPLGLADLLVPETNFRIVEYRPAVQRMIAFQPEFADVVDQGTNIRLVEHRDYPFAHEAGVYLEKLDKVIFVSNILDDGEQNKFIEINSLDLKTGTVTTVDAKSILMANGAAKVSENTLVFASQGLGTHGGSLISLNMATMETKTVVDNWHGLKFNSPNDIIKIGEGQYLWTDPPYGFAQKFRTGEQELAPFVWYHDAEAGITRPILEGFVKPNGICLSPDRTVLYVSDTGCISGDGKTDINAPKSIYAYDIQLKDHSVPIITNRRLFAVADNGIPDGLKVDTKGNLYAGVGAGVDVFNPQGILIGKILTPTGTGVANLVFVKDTLYMFAETDLFAVKLKVKGHPL